MRPKQVQHKTVASQVTINAPIKVLNLVGTKKCIVVTDPSQIKHIKSIKKTSPTPNIINLFQTVDKDNLQPSLSQALQSFQTQQTPSLIITSAGSQNKQSSHIRHISTLDRTRKKNMHDAMLDQELQNFRQEVEYRFKCSLVNSSYKFPRLATEKNFASVNNIEPQPENEEPNYTTISMNVYDPIEKNTEESGTQFSYCDEVLKITTPNKRDQSTIKSIKKAEFCKRVKDILTGGNTFSLTRNELKKSETGSTKNKRENTNGFFQAQRKFLSPDHVRGNSRSKINNIRNMHTVRTYMGEIVAQKNKVRKVESGILSERSKDDLNDLILSTLQCEPTTKKVHLRQKTVDKNQRLLKRMPTANVSSAKNLRINSITPLNKRGTTPRKIKISKPKIDLQTQTFSNTSKMNLPFDIQALTTMHDFSAAPINKIQNDTYFLYKNYAE